MAIPSTFKAPVIESDIIDLRTAVKDFKYTDASHPRLDKVQIGGEWFKTGERFFTSIASMYGFSPNIFKIFNPDEVFTRLVDRKLGDKLQITYEVKNNKKGEQQFDLLGCSKPGKSGISVEDVMQMMEKLELTNAYYAGGQVCFTSMLDQGTNGGMFAIGGDDFKKTITTEVPIDMFGSVATYLSLLRTVCSNGAVGMAPMFKNTLKLPDSEVKKTVARYIAYFNNVDGFDELKDKWDIAAKTPLSVNELNKIVKAIDKAGMEDKISHNRILRRLEDLSGACGAYQLSSLSELSVRKSSILPTKLSVYDGLNIVTEVSTHFPLTNARAIHAMVGDTLASEFNLQGIIDFTKNKKDLAYQALFFDDLRN